MLIGYLHLQNETLVNRVQDMSHKVIKREVLTRLGALEYFSKYVDNLHIYQARES